MYDKKVYLMINKFMRTNIFMNLLIFIDNKFISNAFVCICFQTIRFVYKTQCFFN